MAVFEAAFSVSRQTSEPSSKSFADRSKSGASGKRPFREGNPEWVSAVLIWVNGWECNFTKVKAAQIKEGVGVPVNHWRKMWSVPLLMALMSCTEESMPDASDGAVFFAENCATCHGSTGQGDGHNAADLSVAPTDLTNLSRENDGVFPAARALSYIYGDPQQGHLARVMPQFGGAMADDLVPVEIDGVFTPTPRALAGLLFYLESIQE